MLKRLLLTGAITAGIMVGTCSVLAQSETSQSVVINEFMASNSTAHKNLQGEYTDWLELYNSTSQPFDLSGCYLTDTETDLTKWAFPEGTTLSANGYLLVYCDSWDKPQPVNELHANFSLNKAGEYLALIASDGTTVIDEFTPSYPTQYNNISCSHDFYYKTPTPGQANAEGYGAPVADVTFSEPGGYMDTGFNLILSTETEGATIHYTTNGTIPTAESTVYTSPIPITKISFIRAIAVKEGCIDSGVTTRTWLFADEILSQPTSTPSGWPSSGAVNGQKMEYGMSQSVVSSNREMLLQGMTNIGSISVVTDLKNLFDAGTGVYVNAWNDGPNWERPISLELFEPNGDGGFQIDAGIRIRGAFSRSSSNPKHSLRFFFRDTYGGKLEYPLFGTEGAGEFDKVDLRTSQNFSWSYENSPYNTFIRETFSRDSQRDMNTPYARSRYYHLYINGQYWGLYQTEERCDSDYGKTYFGGSGSDWDCIKTSHNGYKTEAADGTMDAFTDLYKIAVKQGFSGIYSTNYYWIKGIDSQGYTIPGSPVYLDEESLMAYMLITYFARDPDCPVAVNDHANNLFGLYNRNNPSGFKWFKHDGEHSMAANRGYPVSTDLTAHGWQLNDLGNFNPMRLHQKLMDHPDYKMKWIDLVQKEMLNEGGALTIEKSLERWNKRQNELNEAIVMEAARWGHGMGRATWLAECDYTKNEFIKPSGELLLKNFKSRGWYPSIEVPILKKISESADLVEVTLSGNGTRYYTTDGSDPRLPGGSINPFATEFKEQIVDPITIVEKESDWLYFDQGTLPPKQGSLAWYHIAHKHTDWKTGNARFGYGNRPVATEINNLDPDGNPLITAYFVKYVQVASKEDVDNLVLKLNVDDGAVVYINGYRELLHNMPSTFEHNTLATTKVSGTDEVTYKEITIDSKHLNPGRNIIAVEVHQYDTDDTDLYFDLELLGTKKQEEAVNTIKVRPGTTIKARCWNGAEWSAIAEMDCTTWGNPIEDLRITELMYSSDLSDEESEAGFKKNDFAWLEFCNIGSKSINLEGIRVAEGIDFTFPAYTLSPSERVVLAKDPIAFASRYDTEGIMIFSDYSGNLAKKGETIALLTATGENIFTFTYSNAWYPETDGQGYTLVVVDPTAPEEAWNTAENWKASETLHGSPGSTDDGQGFAPIIKDQSISQQTIEGKSVTFYVTAVGSSPLSYQWKKDGIDLPGETSGTLYLSNLTTNATGVYTATVSNQAGSVTSDPINLIVEIYVPNPVRIFGQPENISGYVGQSASFTVVASGDDLTFQWYKNGFEIANETNSVYTIESLQKSDQSNFYYVVVSNFISSETSAKATVTVADGPLLQKGDSIIAIAPSNSGYPNAEDPPNAIDNDVETKYLNYGGKNSGFIVTPAKGSSIASAFRITTANDAEERDPTSCAIYGTNDQIRSRDNGKGTRENWSLIAECSVDLSSERFKDSAIISFENSAVYSSYKVIFPTLKGGSMMQLAEFQLFGTVWKTGAPTVDPINDFVITEWEKLTIQGSAMGTLPLYYQWLKDDVEIPGATDSALTLTEIQMEDAGEYTFRVSNKRGTASSKFNLTVLPGLPVLPSIKTQPTNQTVLTGATVNFEVVAIGTKPLLYQWYRNGIPMADATNSVFTIEKVTEADPLNTYNVLVTNPVGSVLSDSVSVSVSGISLLNKGDFIIGIGPNADGYPPGEEPANAIDGDVGTKYLNRARENSGLIATPSVGSSIVTAFELYTANDAEERDPTSIIIYGTNEEIVSTDMSTGTAEKWEVIYETPIDLPSARFTGSGTYFFENEIPYTSYKVVFPTLKMSGALMQIAEVKLYGTPWLIGKPTIYEMADCVVMEGEDVTIKATVMGSAPVRYQWLKDNQVLSGKTSMYLNLYKVTKENEGIYRLRANNSKGVTISQPITLTVISNEPEIATLEYAIEDGKLILNFTGTLYQSNNMQDWEEVTGAESPYLVDPTDDVAHYYRTATK